MGMLRCLFLADFWVQCMSSTSHFLFDAHISVWKALLWHPVNSRYGGRVTDNYDRSRMLLQCSEQTEDIVWPYLTSSSSQPGTWQACAYNLFGRVHGWLSFRGALSSTLLWECLHVNSTLFFLAFIVLLIERALESSVHTSPRSKDENVKILLQPFGLWLRLPSSGRQSCRALLDIPRLGGHAPLTPWARAAFPPTSRWF